MLWAGKQFKTEKGVAGFGSWLKRLDQVLQQKAQVSYSQLDVNWLEVFQSGLPAPQAAIQAIRGQLNSFPGRNQVDHE